MTISSTRVLLTGFILAVLIALSGCKKESDVATDPTQHKPDRVVVTVTKDTLFTDGRDSSFWTFQLYKNGSAFQEPFSVTAMTDLGFFKEAGLRVRRATFPTDATGKAMVYFYGDFNPGFDQTLVWGDGFGVDTITTVLIIGNANSVTLYFRDPSSTEWVTTDTLRAGAFRGKADSTFVRVTVKDKDGNPLPSVRVDLEVLVGGLRPAQSKYGYFKSTLKPDSVATGLVYTDASGEALDTFYSDDLPTFGKKILQIIAQVENGTFGRIAISRFIVISA